MTPRLRFLAVVPNSTKKAATPSRPRASRSRWPSASAESTWWIWGAGAGVNAIGFSRTGCTVTAIEQDGNRLALARHNARCYGVESQIRFVQGDGVTLLSELDADLLFVDPPWGRDYSKQRVGLADLPLLKAALSTRARFGALWAKVPVSFVTDDTPQLRPEAVFGRAGGDARRIMFLWLTTP